MVQQENDMLRSGGAGRHIGAPQSGNPGTMGGGAGHRQPLSPRCLGANMVCSSSPVLRQDADSQSCDMV